MSKPVFTKLKTLFAQYGMSVVFISDNGRQDSSTEFQGFAKAWGFRHLKSSSIYPQSNRLIKKSAQTAKSLMIKPSKNDDNPYQGLLEYRNTPVDGLAAPAQLLMSHQLQSILLRTTKHQQKKVVSEKEFLNLHAERKQQ